MTQQGLRYLSLFSGVEAASLAWKPLGWKAVAFAEFDAFPSAVLAHHYPDVPNLGDVTKIEGSRYRGTVDLVVGGSPCQGFSVAGKQLGLNDERSGLALAYVRLLEEIKPRWFVWENVPGVLSTNGGEDFRAFIEKITEIGYGVSWRILDAQYVRVPGFERAIPQRRRRLFVVGYLGDWVNPAKVLFESQGLPGDIESGCQAWEGFATFTQGSFGNYSKGVGTLRANGGDSGGSETLIVEQTLDEVAPSILASCGEKCFLGNQEAFSGKYFVYENQAQSTPLTESKDTLSTVMGNAEADGRNLPLVLMDQGGGVMSIEEGIVGTLRAQTHGHEPLVLNEAYRISSERSNVMQSRNPLTGFSKTDLSPTIDTVDPSPSKSQGGVAIVQRPHMFKLRSGCEGGGKGYLGQDDMSFTLACNNDQYLMTTEPYALAGNMIGRSDKAGPQGKGYRQETAFTLNSSDVQGVAQTRVRKLTPLECERLMGFPDEYTKVPYRGKSADDCPDSPRYKACGNSMCVNVMRWIGLRIQEVDSSI